MPDPDSMAPHPPDRIESWKAIADYFDRTVRAVQTWEKRESLPVHRDPNARSTVFAYRSELDAWWEGRRPDATASETPRSGRVLYVVSTTGVLALAGWIAWQHLDRPPDPGTIVLRQLDAPAAYRSLGRPSADGRLLPYVDAEGRLALFHLTRKTSIAVAEEESDRPQFPAASPNGNRVAYAWRPGGASVMEVRVVGVGDDSPRTLWRDETVERIEWSSDGRHLLVLSREGRTSEICLVSADDGSTRVLATFEDDTPRGMSLSPDGRYLAYDAATPPGSTGRDIFVRAVSQGNGGEVIRLVRHPANDVYPFWTASGKTLVFASDRSGTLGLWTIAVANGRTSSGARVVQKDLGMRTPLGITRDGALFFCREGTGSSQPLELWVMENILP